MMDIMQIIDIKNVMIRGIVSLLLSDKMFGLFAEYLFIYIMSYKDYLLR